MVKLRTVEKNFDISISHVLSNILNLPDDYTIILSPLNLHKKFNDYVIILISKSSIYLISYQKIISKNLSLEDAIIYLREYVIKFNLILKSNQINLSVLPQLIIVVDKDIKEIYNKDNTEVSIIHFDKIKNFIFSNNLSIAFTDKYIEDIINCFRTNINYKINKYQIISEIEFLDNIIVYLAYDTLREKLFTLKEINLYKEKFDDLEKLELIRDAKLTMKLNHNNILNVEEIIEKENKLYIVTEYLFKYNSLRDFICKRTLNTDEVISIIKQLCDALEYTHSKGIIHRNIRPENILINDELHIKISNFELAKKNDISTRSTFDLKEMIKENPYSAPEFKIGLKGHHNVDQRVDIYSVGVIFYELLTNKIPKYIDEKNFLYPSFFNKDVCKEIDNIVEKALKFDINQRFSTMNSLRNSIINYKYEKDENSSQRRYTNREIYKKTRNSIIYQAIDNKLNKKVALKKVLINGFLLGKERNQKLEKFLAEANILKKLVHPNIVSVYDFFIEDDDAYIVMEWIEGKTLRELRKENKDISVNDVLNIIFQICSAIDYAHYQNIIHKDIKPENIIYNNGRIIIIDFGLANLFETSENNNGYGTAIYMAPEQINNNGIIDQRVDIFSIGVLAYELLTDSYPFEPEIIMNKYFSKKVNIIEPCEINYSVSKNLSNCILKAIKINPEERYSNIKEFVKELKNSMFVSKRKINILKPISIIMITLSFIYPIKYFINKKSINNEENKPQILMTNLKEIFEGKIDSYIPYSNWEPTSILLDNINIQSNIIESDNNTEIYFVINNFTDDKIKIIKNNNLKIFDDYNNDYSSYIDFQTIPNEITEINPNSFSKGYILLKNFLFKNIDKIYISIYELGGKNRKFTFSLKRKNK
ncbi:MAG: hypothetical protein KatS3mg068_2413 [Candidatus Sericytochromatia bacterium]|nr:MAG: hypothetical protein KatS3mg068_2413 [Candidatus Sericytochromatia bacterium]